MKCLYPSRRTDGWKSQGNNRQQEALYKARDNLLISFGFSLLAVGLVLMWVVAVKPANYLVSILLCVFGYNSIKYFGYEIKLNKNQTRLRKYVVSFVWNTMSFFVKMRFSYNFANFYYWNHKKTINIRFLYLRLK